MSKIKIYSLVVLIITLLVSGCGKSPVNSQQSSLETATASGVQYYTAWGINDMGQLGAGNFLDLLTPTVISPATVKRRIKQISTYCSHAALLTRGGKILTWGRNDLGQLGDGTTNSFPNMGKATAVRVGAPFNRLKAVQVAVGGGDFTLALDENGQVWSWGDNSGGVLGIGNKRKSKKFIQYRTTPDKVNKVNRTPLKNIVQIAAGMNHCLALAKNRVTIWGWGVHSGGYMLGGFTPTGSGVGVYGAVRCLRLPTPAKQIQAGDFHSVVLAKNGNVYAWGNNIWNQLGVGRAITMTGKLQKVPVVEDIVKISVKSQINLALSSQGIVYAWGRSDYGQLGNGSITQPWRPVRVTGLPSDIIDIAAGREHCLALDSKGFVYVWGSNIRPLSYFGKTHKGLIGLPPTVLHQTIPVKLATVIHNKNLEAGWHTSFAY